MEPRGEHLLLYDGVCGFCNRMNQFVLRRDARHVFDFASLQSEAGRSHLARFGRSPDAMDTFYVIADYRSTRPTLLWKARAALFVFRTLGASWRWLGAVGALPDSLLNRAYDLVARNRYRIFGKYEACVVPTPEYRQRFIDHS